MRNVRLRMVLAAMLGAGAIFSVSNANALRMLNSSSLNGMSLETTSHFGEAVVLERLVLRDGTVLAPSGK